VIELQIEQLSPQWFDSRIGVPSASCFDKVVTSKGEPSKQAINYAYTLAGERLAGTKTETFQSPAMMRGVEMEAEARQLFELMTGYAVRQTGVCYPDENKQYSCSPDGIIDDQETGLEIKCPMIHTHVAYLLADKLPTEYVQQVQGSMLITGFKQWHFISYYPGLPPLHVIVDRDETFIGKLSAELDKFCATVDDTVKRLKEVAA
jgi:putative phage-type endonuclease